jgi:hypothetical protein
MNIGVHNELVYFTHVYKVKRHHAYLGVILIALSNSFFAKCYEYMHVPPLDVQDRNFADNYRRWTGRIVLSQSFQWPNASAKKEKRGQDMKNLPP